MITAIKIYYYVRTLYYVALAADTYAFAKLEDWQTVFYKLRKQIMYKVNYHKFLSGLLKRICVSDGRIAVFKYFTWYYHPCVTDKSNPFQVCNNLHFDMLLDTRRYSELLGIREW